MIIVVEGPSGAGKTTWCRTHGGRHALLEQLPDHSLVPSDPHEQARFWVEHNVARWQQVIRRERRDGLVVVDTDPFKLAYVWSMWQTRQTTEREWVLQRDHARAAFAAGRYALGDLFYVSDVDTAALRARRDADTTRTRRNFEGNVRLRDSLLHWYAVIDRLEPGRVIFGLPPDGIAPELLALGPRHRRSGAALFDELLANLDSAGDV